MHTAENPILWLVLAVLDFYSWIVLAAVVLSWLLAFNVVNYHNKFVHAVVRMVEALTEPVFRPIRRIMPNLGGLDLSPLVVFFAIIFLQKAVIWVYFNYIFR